MYAKLGAEKSPEVEEKLLVLMNKCITEEKTQFEAHNCYWKIVALRV